MLRARTFTREQLLASIIEPNLAILHTLWGQLKLYLRPDWHEAGPHFERALAIDPHEPVATGENLHTLYEFSSSLNSKKEKSVPSSELVADAPVILRDLPTEGR